MSVPELTLTAVAADLERAGRALARVLAAPGYDRGDPAHAAAHTAQGALSAALLRVLLIQDQTPPDC